MACRAHWVHTIGIIFGTLIFSVPANAAQDAELNAILLQVYGLNLTDGINAAEQAILLDQNFGILFSTAGERNHTDTFKFLGPFFIDFLNIFL